MKTYSVKLTWTVRSSLGFSDQVRAWCGRIPAENIDDAISEAKRQAGAPERATSETRIVECCAKLQDAAVP